MMRCLLRITLLACVAFCAALSATARAQAPFPSRPIHVLVSIPPGGAPDISARLIAQSLGESFGWSVVIENRPGANGNIASEQIAKAPPDGYTLVLHADSAITINPHVYGKLAFDPLKDLLPSSLVETYQLILSANTQLPVRTFAN